MSSVYLLREAWQDQEGSTGHNFYGAFSSNAKAMDALSDLIIQDEDNTSNRDLKTRKVKITKEGIDIEGGWYALRSFSVTEYELDQLQDEGETEYLE